MEIKVFNGVKAMEVSRDKLYTHQVMAENGINIPKYICLLCLIVVVVVIVVVVPQVDPVYPHKPQRKKKTSSTRTKT
jgi:hypothetical protein